MKLTMLNRIILCFEIMTIRSGHRHTAQEKQLEERLGVHYRVNDGSVSVRSLSKEEDKLGFWLAAALDDPKVCKKMKEDINNWFGMFTFTP